MWGSSLSCPMRPIWYLRRTTLPDATRDAGKPRASHDMMERAVDDSLDDTTGKGQSAMCCIHNANSDEHQLLNLPLSNRYRLTHSTDYTALPGLFNEESCKFRAQSSGDSENHSRTPGMHAPSLRAQSLRASDRSPGSHSSEQPASDPYKPDCKGVKMQQRTSREAFQVDHSTVHCAPQDRAPAGIRVV